MLVLACVFAGAMATGAGQEAQTFLPAASGPVGATHSTVSLVNLARESSVTTRAFGRADFTVDAAPCDAPPGGDGLTFRLPATGLRGAHGVDIVISPDATGVDWSAHHGIEFWIRSPAGSAWDLGPADGGARGRIDITVWTGGARADERTRRVDVVPGAGGRWQRVIAPFDTRGPIAYPHSVGRWRSKAGVERDHFSAPWRQEVRRVRLQVPANQNLPIEFTLAGLALYRDEAPDGPSVSLQPGAASGFFFRTGDPFALRIETERLPRGGAANVAVEARDYHGRLVHQESIPVASKQADGRFTHEIRWPNQAPGWFEASATLELAGRPVWRASRGLASLPDLTPAQDAARRESIFGIWPDVHPALGAGFVRKPFKAWEDKPDWRPLRLPHEGVSGVAWVIGAPWEDGKWFAVNSEGYEAWGRRLAKAVEMVAPEGRWRYWGAINEPNVHYWGPMENVVEYHRAVYEAVKRGDPNAKVGGPCPHDISIEYLERFVAAGGARWIDFFDVHGYSANDQAFEAKLDALHEFLRRHDLQEKGIVITETGYTVPAVTAAQQAALLVRTYAVALSRGVEVLVWHALFSSGSRDIASPASRPADNRHPDFNILRNDGSANPAFVAYGIMTRMLLGARYVAPIENLPPGAAGFVFARDDRRVRIAWSRGREALAVNLPAGSDLTLTDLMGTSRALAREADGTVSLTLGADPLYLVDTP